MAAQGAHFLQVILHIAALAEELVPEQAVHGEDSGALGEIPADLLYGIAHRRLVIAQFQQHQHIGVVHLAETGQGVAADFFDGNDTGVVSVEFAERILESLGEDFLIRHMQDVLVYLLGGLTVQGTDYVIGPVRI